MAKTPAFRVLITNGLDETVRLSVAHEDGVYNIGVEAYGSGSLGVVVSSGTSIDLGAHTHLPRFRSPEEAECHFRVSSSYPGGVKLIFQVFNRDPYHLRVILVTAS